MQYDIEINEYGGRCYYIKMTKILHREYGPAVEYDNGDLFWYINGKLHRTDGPAVEYADGYKYWFINGKLHREDGPAIIFSNGHKEYWINDIYYNSKSKYNLALKKFTLNNNKKKENKMNTNIVTFVNGLNRRNFTNNTQRALHTLLVASMEGTGWVSRGSIRVPSAAARLRDLRKDEYGNFDVVCKSSVQLGRTGTRTTFYKLNTQHLSLNQLRQVFATV